MVSNLFGMKKSHVVALFLLSALSFSCSSKQVATTASAPLRKDTAAMVEASNAASLRLMQTVCAAQTDETVWLSPFSVQSALMPLHMGAAGHTAEELRPLMTSLALKNNNQLQVASALWIQPNFEPYTAYLDACRAKKMDLFIETIRAAKVNAWAAEHTNNKITEVLSEPLPPNLEMLIANAVYFRADWENPFRERFTHTEPFYPRSGAAQEVKMMTQKEHYNYFRNNTFAALSVPYRPADDGKQYCLQIILPEKSSSVDEVLASLSTETLKQIAEQETYKKVRLTLPKLELRYARMLNEDLQNLGMKHAFSPGKADFRHIAATRLYVGLVKQDSYLRMDEEGTEAAAVTTVLVRATAMPQQEEVIDFHVNRPYLLLIRDMASGLILFTGKIEKITK